MRIQITGLIGAALFAAAGVAFAAEAATDPMKLALTKADFPANAERMGRKAIDSKRLAELFPGARGKAYITTFRFPAGKKSEFVEDIVVEAGTVGQARTTLAALKKDQRRQAGLRTAVRLPSFGDEQAAAVNGDVRNEEVGGWLIVRRNTIVWELDIDTDPSAQDFGLSKPQAVAELQKYATKQKLRVGNG